MYVRAGAFVIVYQAVVHPENHGLRGLVQTIICPLLCILQIGITFAAIVYEKAAGFDVVFPIVLFLSSTILFGLATHMHIRAILDKLEKPKPDMSYIYAVGGSTVDSGYLDSQRRADSGYLDSRTSNGDYMNSYRGGGGGSSAGSSNHYRNTMDENAATSASGVHSGHHRGRSPARSAADSGGGHHHGHRAKSSSPCRTSAAMRSLALLPEEENVITIGGGGGGTTGSAVSPGSGIAKSLGTDSRMSSPVSIRKRSPSPGRSKAATPRASAAMGGSTKRSPSPGRSQGGAGNRSPRASGAVSTTSSGKQQTGGDTGSRVSRTNRSPYSPRASSATGEQDDDDGLPASAFDTGNGAGDAAQAASLARQEAASGASSHHSRGRSKHTSDAGSSGGRSSSVSRRHKRATSADGRGSNAGMSSLHAAGGASPRSSYASGHGSGGSGPASIHLGPSGGAPSMNASNGNTNSSAGTDLFVGTGPPAPDPLKSLTPAALDRIKQRRRMGKAAKRAEAGTAPTFIRNKNLARFYVWILEREEGKDNQVYGYRVPLRRLLLFAGVVVLAYLLAFDTYETLSETTKDYLMKLFSNAMGGGLTWPKNEDGGGIFDKVFRLWDVASYVALCFSWLTFLFYAAAFCAELPCVMGNKAPRTGLTNSTGLVFGGSFVLFVGMFCTAWVRVCVRVHVHVVVFSV